MNYKDAGYVLSLASMFIFFETGSGGGFMNSLAYACFWIGLGIVLFNARNKKDDVRKDE